MFQKQLIMRRVLYSVVPIFLFSIYLYGWRVLALTATVFALGILAEFIMEKRRNKKVSEAVLVTCALFTLSLPPATPLWIAAVGILFAVFMGKEVYGGFGRNVFNPAITGRLFIYITFPTVLARSWMVPGAFGTAGQAGVDTITAATPLAALRSAELADPTWQQLLIGLRAGSIGESSIILLVLGAIYLIWTKTAQWRLIVSTILSYAALSSILYFTGVATEIAPHIALMVGSIMYISVYMTTDPVSAPNKPGSQWIYGFIIATVSLLVRTFSGFPEGTSFGILMGNVFASLIDELMPKPKKKKKAASKPKKKTEGQPAAKEATA